MVLVASSLLAGCADGAGGGVAVASEVMDSSLDGREGLLRRGGEAVRLREDTVWRRRRWVDVRVAVDRSVSCSEVEGGCGLAEEDVVLARRGRGALGCSAVFRRRLKAGGLGCEVRSLSFVRRR